MRPLALSELLLTELQRVETDGAALPPLNRRLYLSLRGAILALYEMSQEERLAIIMKAADKTKNH